MGVHENAKYEPHDNFPAPVRVEHPHYGGAEVLGRQRLHDVLRRTGGKRGSKEWRVGGRCDHARARDRPNTKRTTDTKRSCVVTKKVSRKGLAVTATPHAHTCSMRSMAGCRGAAKIPHETNALFPKIWPHPVKLANRLFNIFFVTTATSGGMRVRAKGSREWRRYWGPWEGWIESRHVHARRGGSDPQSSCP